MKYGVDPSLPVEWERKAYKSVCSEGLWRRWSPAPSDKPVLWVSVNVETCRQTPHSHTLTDPQTNLNISGRNVYYRVICDTSSCFMSMFRPCAHGDPWLHPTPGHLSPTPIPVTVHLPVNIKVTKPKIHLKTENVKPARAGICPHISVPLECNSQSYSIITLVDSMHTSHHSLSLGWVQCLWDTLSESVRLVCKYCKDTHWGECTLVDALTLLIPASGQTRQVSNSLAWFHCCCFVLRAFSIRQAHCAMVFIYIILLNHPSLLRKGISAFLGYLPVGCELHPNSFVPASHFFQCISFPDTLRDEPSSCLPLPPHEWWWCSEGGRLDQDVGR